MSMQHQCFLQDPPNLALPPIKTQAPPTYSSPDNENSSAIPVLDDHDDLRCRTPTSKEHRLPLEASTCPPAPRKPRMVVSRKRPRLSESGFFDVVNREEVEAFFSSMNGKSTSRDVVKRMCSNGRFSVQFL